MAWRLCSRSGAAFKFKTSMVFLASSVSGSISPLSRYSNASQRSDSLRGEHIAAVESALKAAPYAVRRTHAAHAQGRPASVHVGVIKACFGEMALRAKMFDVAGLLRDPLHGVRIKESLFAQERAADFRLYGRRQVGLPTQSGILLHPDTQSPRHRSFLEEALSDLSPRSVHPSC